MDINYLYRAVDECLAFDEEHNVLGSIIGIDLIDDTVIIVDKEGDEYIVDKDKVTLLEVIGEFDDCIVYNKDVFVDENNKLVELSLVENRIVRMYELDRKLQRVRILHSFYKDDLAYYLEGYDFVGNKFEIETEEDFEFNIKLIRKGRSGDVTYYYVCNNKEKGEIDLIKVIFIGHKLIEEENYERITMSYDEYLDLINSDEYKEVNPQELLNYVVAVTYEEDIDEEEDVDNLICEDCGKSFDECECDW